MVNSNAAKTLINNITTLMNRDGLNPASLGKKSGVSSRTIHYILNEERGASIEVAEKIALAFNISIEELLSNNSPKNQVMEESATYSLDTIFVKMLSAEGGQGNGISDQLNHDEVINQIEVTKAYINNNLPACSSNRNLRIITGRGRSMQPLYNDGDMLWIDTGTTELDLDAVYVLWHDNELIIKNVQRKFKDGKKTYLLIPENKAYETVEISEKDNIKVLGLVLGALNFNKF